MTTVNLGIESAAASSDEVGMLRLAIGEQGLSDKYLKCDGSVYSLYDYPDLLVTATLIKIMASQVNATINGWGSSYSLAYGNGTYVVTSATSGEGTSRFRIYTSTNLTNWTTTEFTGDGHYNQFVMPVHFINGRFIIFDWINGRVFTSLDGISWQHANVLPYTGSYYAIRAVLFKGRYYVGDYKKGLSVSATDDPLSTWSSLIVDNNITSHGVNAVDAHATTMCCVNFRGSAIYRTTNGSSYSKRYGSDPNVGSVYTSDIIYLPWAREGAGRWLASLGSLNRVVYSDNDGLTWQIVPNAPVGTFTCDDQHNIALATTKGELFISQDEGMTFFGDLNGTSKLQTFTPVKSNGTNIMAMISGGSSSFRFALFDPILAIETQRNVPTLKDSNGTFYYVRAKK